MEWGFACTQVRAKPAFFLNRSIRGAFHPRELKWMAMSDPIKIRIAEDNKEAFAAAVEVRAGILSSLRDFNAREVKLTDIPPHKRIFLFFLARVIKTYSVICMLCREGFGQDTSPLLRNLLETLVSAKYITCKPDRADQNAVRFVEYKWVILKRYLSELEKEFSPELSGDEFSDRDLILSQFEEYKKNYGITSDRALLTWSGKSIRDMARQADKNLLKEYELAFRIDSRFSHPSIIGDKEYVDFKEEALVLSFLPSPNGVVLSLKRAMTYLTDFWAIFNALFELNGDDRIKGVRSKSAAVFKMEKYKGILALEKTMPNLDKERADKMHIRFDVPSGQ